MSELFNVEEYLQRMGIGRAKAPTPAFLDELVSAHQHTVPFENLDVYEKHLAPSLDVDDLFRKIVRNRRGGYCFELNGLFNALLQGLGYRTYPLMARVIMRGNPDPVLSHRANVAVIDGEEYLTDVGFGGPMAGFAPRLADGASRTEDGQTFTLHRMDPYWWEVGYTSENHDDWRVLRLCAMPAEEQDFIPLSFFQSQNPQSVFRQTRMANIKTADGAFDLRGSTYTEFSAAGKTSREVEEAEIDGLLADKFGIRDWR